MHYAHIDHWRSVGLKLAWKYRSVMFPAGDWYNDGRAQFGVKACRSILAEEGFGGLTWDSLRVFGCIARRYSEPLRHLNCEAGHYQAAAPLPDAVAIPLLEQAARERWTVNELRIAVQRIRYHRPLNGTDVVTDLQTLFAQSRKFRGLLADPPTKWQTSGGKKGGSDVHYPAMSYDELKALPVSQVATDDAFLFLWTPAAAMKDGINLLEAWGFEYVTCATWDKLDDGVGYYFRMVTEHLLVGRCENTQRHFDDGGISSMIREARGKHSAKPRGVHDIVRRAIGGPYLELFGRKSVDGWTVVGNQIAIDDGDKQLAAD